VRLWESSRPRLLKLCLRLTRGNLSEAEDLLSEACVRAIEAESEGVDVRSPLSFSIAIIKNLARDRWRSARDHEAQLSFEGSEPRFASGAPGPDEQVCTRESLTLAFRVLQSVPPRQRQALVLRTLGDDYSCIARNVGTSEQNARKLVQSARAAMQLGG
jgi:RNA polymerase sigma factor (sigma-70 family)